MTSLETVSNDQTTGIVRTLVNNRAKQNQEEHMTLPVNTARIFTNISRPNTNGDLILLGTHEAKLQRRLNEMEDMIRRILGMSASIKKSYVNSYVDSLFADNIALVEMPRKFNFPNMKLYNGIIDLDDHIAQYKQQIFTAAILRDLIEACMCKGLDQVWLDQPCNGILIYQIIRSAPSPNW